MPWSIPDQEAFHFFVECGHRPINPGWPVDVNATARYKGMTFTSSIQNQRAALGLVNGVIYVPYSGHFGDCGTYHG
jgi:hypothetical protein